MNEQRFSRDDDRLDEFIRQSLSGIQPEPSKRVWKRLSLQLLRSELLRFRFTNIPRSFWGVAIPAAVIITGAIIFFGTGEEPPAADVASLPPPPQAAISTAPSSTVSKPPVTVPETTPVAPSRQTATRSGEAAGASLAAGSSVQTDVSIPAGASGITGTTSLSVPAVALATPADNSMTDRILISVMSSMQAELPLSGIVTGPFIGRVDNPAPREISFVPPALPLNRSMDIGINITPDMVFYRGDAGSFKYNYTFDLGARYNLGRFFLQSGLGMTYSSDIGDYAISYLKNDSVGFYYTINSFIIDPGGTPIFTMKEVTVYDSVQYLYDYSTRNKYYYLQIPLSAGYRIIDRPSWRLSAEAGLLYAYLFSLNEPTPVFHVPEGRILSIDRRTPERNRHSLGITGGLAFEYRFAGNFFLLIEPTFKYYLRTIEENSSRGDKQPYSIGLRAGIWYRLDFKNRTR